MGTRAMLKASRRVQFLGGAFGAGGQGREQVQPPRGNVAKASVYALRLRACSAAYC